VVCEPSGPPGPTPERHGYGGGVAEIMATHVTLRSSGGLERTTAGHCRGQRPRSRQSRRASTTALLKGARSRGTQWMQKIYSKKVTHDTRWMFDEHFD